MMMVNYKPSAFHGHEDTKPYIFWGHDLFGVVTFWGHVTSSVTWSLDSVYVVSYWRSIVTMRLSCTVTELQSVKVAFAHVKGQKFTAHAPCHVTCRQGFQNDHIFGIPEAILPIHCTTFMGPRWRLGAVYRWNFYTGAFFGRKFLSVFGFNFRLWRIFQGLDINFKFWFPKRFDPYVRPSCPSHRAWKSAGRPDL